jgi:hypothetical protein
MDRPDLFGQRLIGTPPLLPACMYLKPPVPDHGPDALLEPSERLLVWWTGHCQDVQEAFAVGA